MDIKGIWNIKGEKLMQEIHSTEKNIHIEAGEIELGKEVILGTNIKIKVKGLFRLGDYGNLGHDVFMRASYIDIGPHFFHMEPGLKIGGGGSSFPDAVLKVGARCVFHNNYINLARPIEIGDDVGLSPGSELLTHGFWYSILEGYPQKYAGIKIGNNVHIGQRTMVLQGIEITNNIVVGANSTVTKSLLEEKAIYAGTPAKFVRKIVVPPLEERIKMVWDILNYYKLIGGKSFKSFDYPFIHIDQAFINVDTMTLEGTETIDSDKLRDLLRRYGIRIYSEIGRPFVSVM